MGLKAHSKCEVEMLPEHRNPSPWLGEVQIEDWSYGTMQLEGDFRHGEWAPPCSLAYFCPHCGRVWAKISVVSRPYFVWCVCCERCAGVSHLLEVAGSLWLSWDRTFNEALPTSVLRREFEIHCKHADKHEMMEEL
jgi:hypothetical protein